MTVNADFFIVTASCKYGKTASVKYTEPILLLDKYINTISAVKIL